jgi:hypothetical protein
MKIIYAFRAQKGESRPVVGREPAGNLFCAPKSVLLYDKSIVRVFYTKQEKIYFCGLKRQKKAFRAQT